MSQSIFISISGISVTQGRFKCKFTILINLRFAFANQEKFHNMLLAALKLYNFQLSPYPANQSYFTAINQAHFANKLNT